MSKCMGKQMFLAWYFKATMTVPGTFRLGEHLTNVESQLRIPTFELKCSHNKGIIYLSTFWSKHWPERCESAKRLCQNVQWIKFCQNMGCDSISGNLDTRCSLMQPATQLTGVWQSQNCQCQNHWTKERGCMCVSRHSINRAIPQLQGRYLYLTVVLGNDWANFSYVFKCHSKKKKKSLGKHFPKWSAVLSQNVVSARRGGVLPKAEA